MKRKYVERLQEQWENMQYNWDFQCDVQTMEFVEYLLRHIEKDAEKEEQYVSALESELDNGLYTETECEACRGWKRT